MEGLNVESIELCKAQAEVFSGTCSSQLCRPVRQKSRDTLTFRNSDRPLMLRTFDNPILSTIQRLERAIAVFSKMATWIRNAISGPSRIGLPKTTPLPVLQARAFTASTTFAYPADFRTPNDRSPSTNPFARAPASNPFRFNLDNLRSSSNEPADPNRWWKDASMRRDRGVVNDKYTARSTFVTAPTRYMKSYRVVQKILRQGDVRTKVRKTLAYEAPSIKKRRLASERHRRRFKAMVGNFLKFSLVYC